jgi:phosphopantothenoylcysteine synthetase/decarboxylase
MNVLVTAGNTQAPIDKVRCVTNVFTGRTGAAIALEAHRRGHAVTLVTSHPDAVEKMHARMFGAPPLIERWSLRRFRTFEELEQRLTELVPGDFFDAVVLSAAASDYLCAGVYAPAEGTRFHAADNTWLGGDPPALVERSAPKVKSDEPELWLRLVKAPKLVDRVRTDWGFRGVLVKFKLEAEVGDVALLDVAEQSRRQSGADLMAANTFEGRDLHAFIGPFADGYHRVARGQFAAELIDAVEVLHRERKRG